MLLQVTCLLWLDNIQVVSQNSTLLISPYLDYKSQHSPEIKNQASMSHPEGLNHLGNALAVKSRKSLEHSQVKPMLLLDGQNTWLKNKKADQGTFKKPSDFSKNFSLKYSSINLSQGSN